MEAKICPYCMQMTFGDFCKNCKKKVDYHGKPMQLPVGTELQGYHRYLVGAALGQGGFGVTYLALDMDTNERVAIKEFFPVHCSGRPQGTMVMAYDGQNEDFEKGKRRFLLEAQTLQQLSSIAAVVAVYDCFQANNTVYLAMEYVQGESLQKYLEEKGPIAPKDFFPLIRPLLEDAAKMHRQGVIHRDIAPDNILLDTNGKLRLIDFGTAREYMSQASMTVVVKKGFAPVEQYNRRGQNAATDVYALAATIYYCITGRMVPASMDRFEKDTLKRPSEWGAKIPRHQEDALMRALNVRAADRTQTVDALLAELFPQREEPELLPEPESEPVVQMEPKTEPKPILKTEPKTESKPILKAEPKTESKPIPEPIPEPKPKTEPAPIPKAEPKPSPAVKNRAPKKKTPIWIGLAAAVVLVVLGIVFAVSAKKEVPKVRTEPVATEAEANPIPESAEKHREPTAETIPDKVPIRNVSQYAYAYSDDPADNARYTAEEFAQIVKSENVRDLLPLGTKIKMVPNSSEITDAFIEFELVAYKHFRLADGADMAKTTWLAVNLLNENRQMNTERTNEGGWAESDLRHWLNESLYPTLPNYWKTLMQGVQVCSTAGEGSYEIVTSIDYLFLPSATEADSWRITGGFTQEIDAAAEEKTFSCFTDNVSRIKNSNGTAASWWLRSPYLSSTQFDTIKHVGYSNGSYATGSFGVCIGFCI